MHIRGPVKKTGPVENPWHTDYHVSMKTHISQQRATRRNELARTHLSDPEALDRTEYIKVAERWSCSLRTVYRDMDWVLAQLSRGWEPPTVDEEAARASVGPSRQLVDTDVSRFPDHRLAIEDSMIEGRWSNREAQRIDEAYDGGGVRKVLRAAEGVKESICSDLDADGIRLSVSIQLKRLHRTVSRHVQLQNDDLALKAESELAKLHRGVIPMLGKLDGSEDMTSEEKDFYTRLLGTTGGQS